MGGSTSREDYEKQQTQLIQQINDLARDLTDKYSTKFLDPKFCTTIALTYTDKLINYSKNELNGVALNLGVVANVPEMKDKLCTTIVKHYTDRINLIAAIQASLSYCSDRIFALVAGPRCEGNPEIFTQSECSSSGGTWVPSIVPPDESLEQNNTWYHYLYSMEEMYLTTLTRLLEILQELRDYSESINSERLKELGEETGELIEKMQNYCQELYKLALTVPTFTDAELRAMNEEDQISKQEAAAREAALRASRGLPTVPAS